MSKNLKILIAIALWSTSIDSAIASTDSLLNSDSGTWSSSLSLEGTTIGSTPGSLLGIGWSQMYQSGINLGVKFAGLVTDVDAPANRGRGEVSYYFGGATAGYRVLQWKLIGLESDVLFGAGKLGYRDAAKDEYRSGGFFTLVPGAAAYIRIFDQTDVGFGVGYRTVVGSEVKELLGYSTSGFMTQLALRSVFDW